MPKVINWLRTHPAFIGPALAVAAIAALLYLFIDPISVLFFAIIALVAGFAAFFDPKTYFRKPPTDEV
jgi:hypothetical protein